MLEFVRDAAFRRTCNQHWRSRQLYPRSLPTMGENPVALRTCTLQELLGRVYLCRAQDQFNDLSSLDNIYALRAQSQDFGVVAALSIGNAGCLVEHLKTIMREGAI